MQNNIIQFRDFLNYYHIDSSYNGRIACLRLDSAFVKSVSVPAGYMNMFSFVLVQKGSLCFDINYKTVTLERGDMLLVFPNLFVGGVSASNDFEGLNLLCERYMVEHLLTINSAYNRFSLFFNTCFPLIHVAENFLAELAYSMEHILRQIGAENIYQEDILTHLLHVCLLQILALIEDRNDSDAAKLKHAETLFLRFVDLALTNYKKEHQIKFYADKMCVSTTYLSRIVRQVTGKTVNDFLSGLLYSEACRLLSDTDSYVNAIAEKLCFTDQSSFGKFFKSKAGLSPQAYRQQKKAVKVG